MVLIFVVKLYGIYVCMVLIFVVNLYMYGSHGSHMVPMVLSFVVILKIITLHPFGCMESPSVQ